MATCEICEVLQQSESRLLETKHWLVTLAEDQAYLGRVYVTARQHWSSLGILPAEAWLESQQVIGRYEEAVRQAFGADNVNWCCLLNNAFQASMPRPHVHWHGRPRYAEPVWLEGVKFTDPEHGHHYDRARHQLVDDGLRREIETTLREYL